MPDLPPNPYSSRLAVCFTMCNRFCSVQVQVKAITLAWTAAERGSSAPWVLLVRFFPRRRGSFKFGSIFGAVRAFSSVHYFRFRRSFGLHLMHFQ